MTTAKKGTKDQLQTAVNGKVAKIQEKNSGKLTDPAQVAQAAEQAKVNATAQKIASEDVHVQLSAVQRNVLENFAKLGVTLAEDVKRFQALTTAIADLETTLDERYGVQVQAETLAGLIEAIGELNGEKADLEAQVAAIRLEVSVIREQLIATATDEAHAHAAALTAQANETHRRSDENWNYEHERTKTRQTNEVQDEIARQRKAFESECTDQHVELSDRETELDDREEKLDERQDKFDSLEARVDGIQAEIDAAVAKALNDAKGKAEADKQIAINAATKDLKSTNTVLETENKLIKERLVSLEEEKRALTSQVDVANQRVQTMTLEMIKASSKTVVVAAERQESQNKQ